MWIDRGPCNPMYDIGGRRTSMAPTLHYPFAATPLWRDTGRAMRKLFPLAVAICVALPARAAPSCKAITVTPLAFGSYDVYGPSPLDSAGTISYSCPPPTTPAVTIDQGLAF